MKKFSFKILKIRNVMLCITRCASLSLWCEGPMREEHMGWCGAVGWPSTHCWRMVHWYQHVSAGPIGADTNVHEPYKAGTLVPARNSSRH